MYYVRDQFPLVLIPSLCQAGILIKIYYSRQSCFQLLMNIQLV